MTQGFIPFTSLKGLVAPLDRANVDTDAIIPKQFMKSIRRTGFGDNLFDAWRYLDHGEPGQDCRTRPVNPDFVLNQSRYLGAQILLTRENFGCGSSREHAIWALGGQVSVQFNSLVDIGRIARQLLMQRALDEAAQTFISNAMPDHTVISPLIDAGFDFNEVAAMLGISHQSVRANLARPNDERRRNRLKQ